MLEKHIEHIHMDAKFLGKTKLKVLDLVKKDISVE